MAPKKTDYTTTLASTVGSHIFARSSATGGCKGTISSRTARVPVTAGTSTKVPRAPRLKRALLAPHTGTGRIRASVPLITSDNSLVVVPGRSPVGGTTHIAGGATHVSKSLTPNSKYKNPGSYETPYSPATGGSTRYPAATHIPSSLQTQPTEMKRRRSLIMTHIATAADSSFPLPRHHPYPT